MPPSSELKDYDVFYIHPTGYFQTHWNAPLDPESAAYERTNSHLATQASAFAETCNVYAPYYRQATYYSFFDEDSNGYKAQDLAYSDLSNAFCEYLENHNQGRPFIIAGHSQGALHGQRLVHEHISQQPIRELFIAAYLIGYILPIKYFDQLYPDLIISNDAEDQHQLFLGALEPKIFEEAGLIQCSGCLKVGAKNPWSSLLYVRTHFLGIQRVIGFQARTIYQ